MTPKSARNILGGLALLAAAAQASEGATDAGASLRTSAYTDMGQVVRGINKDASIQGAPVENLYVSRIGVSMLSEIRAEDRLLVKVGVGGLFWYPWPTQGQWWVKRIQFGPGISEASFQYDLGTRSADEEPGAFIKGGFFDYKYNPDARNLGEYLLRSECYPGLLTTSGWSLMNTALYQSMGLQARVTLLNGKLTNDFLLFSEMERAPIFDVSPSYVGTLRLWNDALELGGGVSLHRFLPVRPSSESPEVRWEQNGRQGNGYLVRNPAFNPDSAATAANPRYVEDTTRFYTLQGVKVMGRVSLDAKAFAPAWREALGPRDLRVYAEAAVLGVKDYPYYYEKILDRTPVMFGLNLPAFKLLDLLSVQFEYYRSPWRDDQYNFSKATTVLPVWPVPLAAYDSGFTRTNVSEDNWKWSVNAVKTLTRGLQVQAQIANDHLRLKGDKAAPTSGSLNQDTDHWYYLVRLQWGL